MARLKMALSAAVIAAAKAKPPQPANEGFWGVVLMGIAMLAILETSGNKPGPGTFIAVLIYVAVGGLYPPIGLMFGGIIILKLLLTHGSNVGPTLSNITSQTKTNYSINVAGKGAQ